MNCECPCSLSPSKNSKRPCDNTRIATVMQEKSRQQKTQYQKVHKNHQHQLKMYEGCLNSKGEISTTTPWNCSGRQGYPSKKQAAQVQFGSQCQEALGIQPGLCADFLVIMCLTSISKKTGDSNQEHGGLYGEGLCNCSHHQRGETNCRFEGKLYWC